VAINRFSDIYPYKGIEPLRFYIYIYKYFQKTVSAIRIEKIGNLETGYG
jgi:hypothetical protein